MGFSNFPPSADQALAVQALTMWSSRADAAIISGELPWAALLAGDAPGQIIAAQYGDLVTFYRAHHLDIVITLDVTDGLNRSAEAPGLVAAGRSITDTAVQRLYRRYVKAIDSVIHPSYLALAMETNLIRAAAPDSVYRAVVAMANAAAADRIAAHTSARLMVTVQVETAWGRFTGSNTFEGIAQDRTDFPFVQALGLSTYPYLGGFADPADVPDDYFGRLVRDNVPVLVTEGGWTSRSVGGVVSSPARQAAWISRESELLEAVPAVGLFQLTFTDLALSAFPPVPDSANLPLFASLGLVDSALTPKPALQSWDSIFALPRSN